MDELPVIQHGHTVQMEAVQANDMAMHTLEHKHRTPVKKKNSESDESGLDWTTQKASFRISNLIIIFNSQYTGSLHRQKQNLPWHIAALLERDGF